MIGLFTCSHCNVATVKSLNKLAIGKQLGVNKLRDVIWLPAGNVAPGKKNKVVKFMQYENLKNVVHSTTDIECFKDRTQIQWGI